MLPSAKTDIVIKDACIFFDLIKLDLLEDFYRLQTVVYTTPQVLSEITNNKQLAQVQVHVDSGRLLIDEAGNLDAIMAIIKQNRGLSFTDASVLELAERKDAAVLSSDMLLRRETVARDLGVRGILWVLEELYLQQVLELEKMLTCLDKYRDENQWSPKKEIAQLKSKYSS